MVQCIIYDHTFINTQTISTYEHRREPMHENSVLGRNKVLVIQLQKAYAVLYKQISQSTAPNVIYETVSPHGRNSRIVPL